MVLPVLFLLYFQGFRFKVAAYDDREADNRRMNSFVMQHHSRPARTEGEAGRLDERMDGLESSTPARCVRSGWINTLPY